MTDHINRPLLAALDIEESKASGKQLPIETLEYLKRMPSPDLEEQIELFGKIFTMLYAQERVNQRWAAKRLEWEKNPPSKSEQKHYKLLEMLRNRFEPHLQDSKFDRIVILLNMKSQYGLNVADLSMISGLQKSTLYNGIREFENGKH